MRLINTITLELHEFFESRIPKYAILSHTWEDEEVTFKDVTKKRNLEAAGWKKIRKCCEFAQERKMDYVWIDTCCIDKRSSAELSEAINSMYRWYADAWECYAYLCDVSYEYGVGGDIDTTAPEEDPELPQDVERAIRASKWFTRGWTLQELIAPSSVRFLDQAWEEIGTRESLEDLIFSITGIESLNEDHESGDSPLYQCVAVKLSWASKRITTRQEDIAYCLMGLFNVNMPLLYGEGKKAFIRLQLEIMKQDNDASIFAWTGRVPEDIGLLAVSPAVFQDSRNVKFDPDNTLRPSFSMSNEGLRLDCFRLVDPDPSHLPYPTARAPSLVPIGCYRDGVPGSLAICLFQYGPSETGCYRIFNSRLFAIDKEMAHAKIRLQGAIKRPVYVMQPVMLSDCAKTLALRTPEERIA